MRHLNLYLAWLTLILGLTLALLSTPPQQDVIWYLLLPSVALALLGLGYLHQYLHQRRFRESAGVIAEFDLTWEKLFTALEQLKKPLEKEDTAALIAQIHEILDDYVIPLTQRQNRLIIRWGKHQAVDILVAMAQGERLLRRQWSAASDAQMREAQTLYPQIHHAFSQAREACDKLHPTLR